MLRGRCHLGIITGHARAGDRRIASRSFPSAATSTITSLLHDVRLRSTHRRILVCAALSLVAIIPRNSHGQRVLGAGEDATVLQAGVIRWTVQVGWSAYNEVYAPGGPLERLAARYSSDSLGAAQLELLRPLRTSLRDLAQLPNADVSLGPMRTDFTARVTRSEFALDIGLTSRLMLTARVPYEHNISEVVVDVNPRNELRNPANIGPNPAFIVGRQEEATAQNKRVVDSLLNASEVVLARLNACAGGSTDPVCADQARARALVNEARAFASGIATTYGTGADTAKGNAFVPMSNSVFQSSIIGRVEAINASFKAYIANLGTWDNPVGAPAPISAVQATTYLSDSLQIAPLGLVERSHIGDIELGAKVLLLDTFGSGPAARAHRKGFGMRVAAGALARLGTAQLERPDDIFDIGTGDAQTDFEGNGAVDFVFGRRFWASVVGRYGAQLVDQRTYRIPDVARNPFIMKYREQVVSRDLGDYIELEASPRWVYNDYLSLSANYLYRRKGEDKYTGVFTTEDPSGEPITLDASILGVGTEQREQRIGGGASFSTLRAYDQGRSRIPIEVQFSHWQSISGSGYSPKQFTTQIQMRYYTRLFGAPLRPGTSSSK